MTLERRIVCISRLRGSSLRSTPLQTSRPLARMFPSPYASPSKLPTGQSDSKAVVILVARALEVLLQMLSVVGLYLKIKRSPPGLTAYFGCSYYTSCTSATHALIGISCVSQGSGRLVVLRHPQIMARQGVRNGIKNPRILFPSHLISKLEHPTIVFRKALRDTDRSVLGLGVLW